MFAMDARGYWVYILAGGRNGTLYVGVTSNLPKRAGEHREGFVDGFTRQYGVHELVWYERHDTAEGAIAREKRLKKWNRAWKGRVVHVEWLGADANIYLDIAEKAPITVRFMGKTDIAVGSQIGVLPHTTRMHRFDASGTAV